MLRIIPRHSSLAVAAAVAITVFSLELAALAATPVDPKTVAEVDAGLGPCTADFTITDEAAKPVYAANIRVHIAYGFMSLHKLDLQAGTNADGKARFIGLGETITAIRRRSPGTTVEVLISDCKGDDASLNMIFEARPDVLNHNLETVNRLQRGRAPLGLLRAQPFRARPFGRCRLQDQVRHHPRHGRDACRRSRRRSAT